MWEIQWMWTSTIWIWLCITFVHVELIIHNVNRICILVYWESSIKDVQPEKGDFLDPSPPHPFSNFVREDTPRADSIAQKRAKRKIFCVSDLNIWRLWTSYWSNWPPPSPPVSGVHIGSPPPSHLTGRLWWMTPYSKLYFCSIIFIIIIFCVSDLNICVFGPKYSERMFMFAMWVKHFHNFYSSTRFISSVRTWTPPLFLYHNHQSFALFIKRYLNKFYALHVQTISTVLGSTSPIHLSKL